MFVSSGAVIMVGPLAYAGNLLKFKLFGLCSLLWLVVTSVIIKFIAEGCTTTTFVAPPQGDCVEAHQKLIHTMCSCVMILVLVLTSFESKAEIVTASFEICKKV